MSLSSSVSIALEGARAEATSALPDGVGPVAHILAVGGLVPAFQPIVELSSGRIFGYESLIRGPAGSAWQFPDNLFAAAEREGLTLDLEIACVETIMRAVATQGIPARVFLNMSAQALTRYTERAGTLALCDLADRAGVPPTKLVVEITEHERVGDITPLRHIANAWRARGVAFALDDFGDGRSSLRLWAELQPDFVKIDKYFTRDIATHAAKAQTFQALRQIAETFGSRLVAEGLEDARSLAVVRDLGVEFGQGYFLAYPASGAAPGLDPAAVQAFGSREVTVLGATVAPRLRGLSLEQMLMDVPPLSPECSCDEVLVRFQQSPELYALAVVDEQRPVGLINRRDFIERFAQPFHRELYGRRSCSAFMDPGPRLIERTADGDEILAILTSEDQRYLTEGFIITDGGRYVGLGSGQQLVRTVSEHRVEAARHANSLTFLPGNIPITDHIERLLRSERVFTASYFDLRHFKPFNDVYGYWRGDEMIRMLAGVVTSHIDPLRDFVGHVGGDDFVVLFQSDDWRTRCQTVIAKFNDRARSLYDPLALQRGGIDAEDRNGYPAFFPLTTLSVGAVTVVPGQFKRAEEVASAAAAAKRVAKHASWGLYVQGEPLESAYEWTFSEPDDLTRGAFEGGSAEGSHSLLAR